MKSVKSRHEVKTEWGKNKASNEHLTKSYTKPQLTLSPHLAPYTQCTHKPSLAPSHGGEWKREEERANV